MTYGLNSSFKRQLNNKSENKRLLAVIILVLIIVFSIVITEREGGATPEESVKRWMKTVKNNEFEKVSQLVERIQENRYRYEKELFEKIGPLYTSWYKREHS